MAGENTNKRTLDPSGDRDYSERALDPSGDRDYSEGRKPKHYKRTKTLDPLRDAKHDRSAPSLSRAKTLDTRRMGLNSPENPREYERPEEQGRPLSRHTRASSEASVLDQQRNSPFAPHSRKPADFVRGFDQPFPPPSSSRKSHAHKWRPPRESYGSLSEMNAPHAPKSIDSGRWPLSKRTTFPPHPFYNTSFMGDQQPPQESYGSNLKASYSKEPVDPVRWPLSRARTFPQPPSFMDDRDYPELSSGHYPHSERNRPPDEMNTAYTSKNEAFFIRTEGGVPSPSPIFNKPPEHNWQYPPQPSFNYPRHPEENRSFGEGNTSIKDIVIPVDREVPTREAEIPVGFCNFEVGRVFEIPYRAREIREFIKHGRKEDIYCAMQKMQGEIETIAELKFSYHINSDRKHNLYDDICKRLELDGVSKDYIDQLFGKSVNPYSLHKFDKLPQSSADYTKAANRLQEALRSSDMESVYAVLTPLGRRIEYLYNLERRYHEKFHEDLHDRVRSQLLGPSRDYTLYLLGETKMETPFFTPTEADRLTHVLSELTFIGTDGEQHKLPFKYPRGGCNYRTYAMNQAISEMGCASKIILIDVTDISKPLRIETPYGRDTPSLQPSVSWSDYHTTSVINVMSKFPEEDLPWKDLPQGTEPRVIDLSLREKQPKVERWAKHMGHSTYTMMSEEDYKKFRESKQKPPEDKAIVFFASRNFLNPDWALYYDLADLIGNKTRVLANNAWNGYLKQGIPGLTEYSLLENPHKLAATFRSALERGATEEARGILKSLESKPEELNEFKNEFPRLLEEVRKQVGTSVIRVGDHPLSFPPGQR